METNGEKSAVEVGPAPAGEEDVGHRRSRRRAHHAPTVQQCGREAGEKAAEEEDVQGVPARKTVPPGSADDLHKGEPLDPQGELEVPAETIDRRRRSSQTRDDGGCKRAASPWPEVQATTRRPDGTRPAQASLRPGLGSGTGPLAAR